MVDLKKNKSYAPQYNSSLGARQVSSDGSEYINSKPGM